MSEIQVGILRAFLSDSGLSETRKLVTLTGMLDDDLAPGTLRRFFKQAGWKQGAARKYAVVIEKASVEMRRRCAVIPVDTAPSFDSICVVGEYDQNRTRLSGDMLKTRQAGRPNMAAKLMPPACRHVLRNHPADPAFGNDRQR
jgi:hypothetical protein